MCIRDSACFGFHRLADLEALFGVLGDAVADVVALGALTGACLLYTSDAADERSSVDLGGRRIINKKTLVRCWASLCNSKRNEYCDK